MDAARDNAADSGDERRLLFHGDDAGGRADDVNHVAFAAACADGVPVGVECADGNGDSGAEAKSLGPLGREMSCDVVGGEVFAVEAGADSVEEGIEFGEELLRRETAPLWVP